MLDESIPFSKTDILEHEVEQHPSPEVVVNFPGNKPLPGGKIN